MGKTCRYVVNAIGKGGETYHTYCKDKQELKKWIADNQERITMDELKIVDRSKNPIMKCINFINRGMLS
ncbi:hypothetical protein [Bacillus kwashiorkori]|uniref:hypothetical protein n=1 Tax=Bacillus kwashiorkori TaxID=1522318 RepID=UPI0007849F67|nr:hypothetical protein [Bacillus kwashiorkori]